MTPKQDQLFTATKNGEPPYRVWLFKREVAKKKAIYEAAGYKVEVKPLEENE